MTAKDYLHAWLQEKTEEIGVNPKSTAEVLGWFSEDLTQLLASIKLINKKKADKQG